MGAIRCLWGVRGRIIAHTEIYILIGGSGIFTSPIRDDPSLSVHTFCVRVGRICRSDTDRERFSESRVDERVAGLGKRLPVPRVTLPPYTRGYCHYLHCARNGRRLCLGHTQYTLSRTLSRDETSLQPAQPVCSADDGCLVVSCHFINHRRPLRGARRPHGGE